MNPYDPSTATRSGVRVTPLVLAGAMSVVVLMLFTVIFLLTREPEPAKPVAVTVPTRQEPTPDLPSQSATTAEPEPEPVPSGEAKFTKDVDPCTLVDEQLRTKLVLYPKETKIYVEECEWQTLPSGAQLPDNMGFGLKVYLKVFSEGVAKAHEQLIARRQDTVLLAETFTKAEPAIGDDSWVTIYSMPGDTGRGPTTATVGVRVSNAVIQVEYDRRVTEDTEGKLRAGALEVAKVVADKLNASG